MMFGWIELVLAAAVITVALTVLVAWAFGCLLLLSADPARKMRPLFTLTRAGLWALLVLMVGFFVSAIAYKLSGAQLGDLSSLEATVLGWRGIFVGLVVLGFSFFRVRRNELRYSGGDPELCCGS